MYDRLIDNTHLAATVIFAAGLLYLAVGLISPSLARAAGRGTVVLRSILAIVLAVGLSAGVIVYTHMQPDGPHSFEGYIRDYAAELEQTRQQGPEAPASEGSGQPAP
ncbi:MAG TPA: hypothetical protein VNR88_06440 [Hyphomicrobium sp.]|nr:hypothetical protein [Hyphomicrobium sp.]